MSLITSNPFFIFQNLNKIKSSFIFLLFLVIGLSSKVVEFPATSVTGNKKMIVTRPVIISDYSNKVFVVLGGGEGERILASIGCKVLSWQSISSVEELVNYNNQKKVVDYYILIEQIPNSTENPNTVNPCWYQQDYFYRIIDAVTLELIYSELISSIDNSSLMKPFHESIEEFDFSNFKYLNSFTDSAYNRIIANHNATQILEHSLNTLDSFSNEPKEKSTKEINAIRAEYYLRSVNAATASFVLGNYKSSLNYIENARKKESSFYLKNNSLLEKKYLDYLESEYNRLDKAYKDSTINFSAKSEVIQFKNLNEDNHRLSENLRYHYFYLSHSLLKKYLIYEHALVFQYIYNKPNISTRQEKKLWYEVDKDRFTNSVLYNYLIPTPGRIYPKQQLWDGVLNIDLNVEQMNTECQQRREDVSFVKDKTVRNISYLFNYSNKVVIRLAIPDKSDQLLGAHTFESNVNKIVQVGEENSPFEKVPKYSMRHILNQLYFPANSINITDYINQIYSKSKK
jgi:hypothetical protein